MTDASVRIYVAQPDGEFDLLLSAGTASFGGFCPDVGDVISLFSRARHFEVVRRQYIMSEARDPGWALVCFERTESQYTSLAITWALDNNWEADVDLREIESRAREARRVLREKKKRRT